MAFPVGSSYLAEHERVQDKDFAPKVSAEPLRRRFELAATGIEAAGDFVAAAVGLIAAYYVYHFLRLGNRIHYPLSYVLVASLAYGVLYVVLLDRDGAYGSGYGMLRIKETERCLRVTVQTYLLIFPVAVFAVQLISRWVLGIGFVLVPLVVISQKQIFFAIMRNMRARGWGMRRAIIYGAGFTGKHVFSAITNSPKIGIKTIAIADDDESKAGSIIYSSWYNRESCTSVISGPLTARRIRSYGADLIIVAIPLLERNKFDAIVSAATEAGASVAFVAGPVNSADSWSDVLDIDGLTLAVFNNPDNKIFYETLKRIFDFIFGVTALVVNLPLLAILALAVRLESRGPAIFKQRRVGKNGRLFDIYKFRSMRVDAPKYGYSPTRSVDPRITRIGRFLRKSSLDELPQLWNVVRGDMSLVGPRPEMPFIVGKYGPREMQRLCVMPGITGIWQLSADRAFQIHENLQYDFYYIRNRSLCMDIAILLHTLFFAVKGI